MMYRVVEIYGTPEVPVDTYGLSQAQILQEEFGLYHLSLDTICRVWTAHSATYSAGWLIGNPEEIERVFRVKLEIAHS